jgi:glycosyltransferase involved in cell wall biosynthesis
MRIAINMVGFLAGEDWNEMVKTLFQQMAKNWPVHEFVFIVESYAPKFTDAANITNTVSVSPAQNGLSLNLWYDYKLLLLLKKQKIDLLVNGDGFCSLRCTIPQVLLVKDDADSQRAFFKKRWQQSLIKAQSIVVFDDAMQTKLLQKGVNESKITLANLFTSLIFQPIDWQKKESIKEKYSEGKEFFLCTIPKNVADPLVLLKAFSLFKKRQQSNMQLLLVVEDGKIFRFLSEKLANYKYRNEVKLPHQLSANEMAELLAASYCVLHFSVSSISFPLANAMQCGVPMIILQTTSIAEMPAGTALYADIESAEAVAEQMKIIYKDENLRSRIIATGFEKAQNSTVENAAAKVWPIIPTIKIS